jgi:hypothetical protein
VAKSKGDTPDKVSQELFIAGESTDWKNGVQGAILQSEAMDFRQKPSQMSVLPGAYPISTALKDLPIVMCQTPDGVRYVVGDEGYIYRESVSKVVSNIGKLNSAGGAGLVHQQQTDNLYMSGQQTVSVYGQVLAGTGQLRQDNFGASASSAPGVIYMYDQTTLSYDGANNTARNNMNVVGTVQGITPSNYTTLVTNTLTNSYTLPSVIAETTDNFCPFIPDIEPFYGVPVFVTTIGTGDLTLTMHDSLNNNLGAVTVPHANVTLGWNLFKFASPGIRAIINPIANGTGSGNHFHLTSSVNGDTAAVATINSSDLTGCNFLLFAYRLVQTNNGWHPMVNFNQYLCVGNGQYLSTYNYANDANPNNSQWVRHQMLLDFGFEITSLSVNNQNLVILAEKRSQNAERNYQEGYLYTWDGVSSTLNKIPVPIGAPYSASSSNGVTYFVVAGSLYAWGGGSQFYKVRYIAYQNTDYMGMADSTIVNPNMMALRWGILCIGYPSSTTNVNLKYGVRTWGAVELTYPNSFGLSYMPSVRNSQNLLTTTAATNYRIGMVYNFVDTMYISWSYVDSASVAHYGLDVIDNFSTPAPNYSAWNLIWDGAQRWKMKRGLRVKINFLPLPANTTLTVGFILDRALTPDTYNLAPTTTATAQALAGATSVVTEIDSNFYEATWGIIGTCQTGTNAPTAPPTITAWAYELDILPEAEDMRSDDIPASSSEGV